MWQFMVGFVSGVYVGTHYDCKPAFALAITVFEKYFPQKKD